MRIEPFGYGGISSYRISSVHGNPVSLSPVKAIGEGNSTNRPLVIAEDLSKKKDLYVKDFGELDKTVSTLSGGFADILGMQDLLTKYAEDSKTEKDTGLEFLNDTIGVMGYNSRLRSQLLGL